MPIVYVALNKVNGKRYIGVTKRSIGVRRTQHYQNASVIDQGGGRGVSPLAHSIHDGGGS